jgi:hypothetical protein
MDSVILKRYNKKRAVGVVDRKVKLNSMRIVLFLMICPLMFAVTLSEIVIDSPLRKTKKETVELITGYKRGDTVSDDDLARIRNNLIASGLFVTESIALRLESDGSAAVLHLSLAEKTSLIPIPLASYSQGAWKGGCFLIENNFGGRGDQLMLGAMAGFDEYSLSAYFIRKNCIPGLLDWGIGGSAVRDETNFINSSGDQLCSDSLSRVRLLDQLVFHTGILKVTGVSPLEFYESSEERAIYFSPGIAAELSDIQFGQFLSEGYTVRGSGIYSLPLAHTGVLHTERCSGEITKVVMNRVRFNGECSLVSYDGNIRYAPELKSPLVDNDVRVAVCGQVSGGVETVCADFSWGYLTIPVSFDGVWLSDTYGSSGVVQYGPVAGIQLYLKKLAIPAMTLYYGFNMVTAIGKGGFSIGMSL